MYLVRVTKIGVRLGFPHEENGLVTKPLTGFHRITQISALRPPDCAERPSVRLAVQAPRCAKADTGGSCTTQNAPLGRSFSSSTIPRTILSATAEGSRPGGNAGAVPAIARVASPVSV